MSDSNVRWRSVGSWVLPVGLAVVLALAMGGAIAWLGGFTSPIIVPAVLGAVAVLIIGVRYGRVPFYFLVISLALGQALSVESMPTTLLTVPGGLAVLAWLARVAVHRAPIVFDRPSMILAIALGVWATLAAFNAGGIGLARSYWLVIIMLFLTPNIIREEKHFVELGWVLALSLGAAATILLFQQASAYFSGFLTSGQRLHAYAQREAIIGASGIVGMRLTKAIPFALIVLFERARRSGWRWLLLMLSVVMISLSILLTVSITASFALLGTFLLVIVWGASRSRRLWPVLVFVLVLILGGTFGLAPLVERVNLQIDVIEEQAPLNWGTDRVLSWLVGLQLMAEAPLLGHGPWVEEASLAYLPSSAYAYQKGGAVPHNFLLSLGAEVGIPGLLMFMVLFGYITVSVWREVRRRQKVQAPGAVSLRVGRAILICLVMLFTQGLAIPVHLDKYLWLLLGIGVAFVHMRKRRGATSTAPHWPD